MKRLIMVTFMLGILAACGELPSFVQIQRYEKDQGITANHIASLTDEKIALTKRVEALEKLNGDIIELKKKIDILNDHFEKMAQAYTILLQKKGK